MKLLSERLAHIYKERPDLEGDRGQQGFIKASGASKSVVNQWLNDKIKSIDIRYALAIERNLGYSHIWLMTGEGAITTEVPSSPSQAFDENVIRVPMGTRPIPVISSVQAGALRDMESPYEPGDGYAVVYTDDMALSRWTFSLEVEGESMMPRFHPGDLLIVDPELSPNPGNFVVARNGTNQATFKKYRPRGIDERGEIVFELVPLNEDYPTLRSDTEKLTVIGVVVEHRNKLR